MSALAKQGCVFTPRQSAFCFMRVWLRGSEVKVSLSSASERKVPPRNLPSEVVSQEPEHMTSF